MKKIWLILLVFVSLSAYSQGQYNYKFGVGPRGGLSWGGSVKAFLSEDYGNALEVIAGYLGPDILLTGLFDHHMQIENSDRYFKDMCWIIGTGVHTTLHRDVTQLNEKKTTFGADILLGLEFIIPKSNFAVGLDVKPFYEFGIDKEKQQYLDAAASVKYVIQY